MNFRTAALIIALAGLPLAACGTPSKHASTSERAVTVSSTSKPSGLASQCKSIRSKYSRIPKRIAIAVSPFNGNMEKVDPTNPTNIIGVEPDLISALSKCLGFTYAYSSEAFSAVIASVTAGADPIGITDLFETPAREQEVDYVSYMVSVDQLITTPTLLSKFKTPLDLCGAAIGEAVGSVEAAYLANLSTQCTSKGKAAITVPQYPDLASAILNVASGTVQGTINSDTLTAQAIAAYPKKIAAGIYFPSLRFTIGLAISKFAASSRLPSAITAAMSKLERHGDVVAILKKWGFPASAEVSALLVP